MCSGPLLTLCGKWRALGRWLWCISDGCSFFQLHSIHSDEANRKVVRNACWWRWSWWALSFLLLSAWMRNKLLLMWIKFCDLRGANLSVADEWRETRCIYDAHTKRIRHSSLPMAETGWLADTRVSCIYAFDALSKHFKIAAVKCPLFNSIPLWMTLMEVIMFADWSSRSWNYSNPKPDSVFWSDRKSY